MATYITTDQFNPAISRIDSSLNSLNVKLASSSSTSSDNFIVNKNNSNNQKEKFIALETDYNPELNTRNLKGLRYDSSKNELQVFNKQILNEKEYLGNYVDLSVVGSARKLKSYKLSNNYSGQGAPNQLTILGSNDKKVWKEISVQNSLQNNVNISLSTEGSDVEYNNYRVVIHSVNKFTSKPSSITLSYSFSNGNGGSGGSFLSSFARSGGGGAGGIVVSGLNANQSKKGANVPGTLGSAAGGSGYGAGGAAAGGTSTLSAGAAGSNGFVYLMNEGVEIFSETLGSSSWTVQKSGKLIVAMIGGGGGGSDSTLGNGGHSGQFMAYALNVQSGDVVCMNIGNGGLSNSNGQDTTVTIMRGQTTVDSTRTARGGLSGKSVFDNLSNTVAGGLANRTKFLRGANGSANNSASLVTSEVNKLSVFSNLPTLSDFAGVISYSEFNLRDENGALIPVTVDNQSDWVNGAKSLYWIFNQAIYHPADYGCSSDYLNGSYAGSKVTLSESQPFSDYNLRASSLNADNVRAINVNASGNVSAINVNASGNVSAINVNASGNVSANSVNASSFTVDPSSSWVPTNPKDLATKKYIDDLLGNADNVNAENVSADNVSAINVYASGNVSANSLELKNNTISLEKSSGNLVVKYPEVLKTFKGGEIHFDLSPAQAQYPLKVMYFSNYLEQNYYIMNEFYVFGSNDQFNWELVHEQKTVPTSPGFTFNNNKIYKHARLLIFQLHRRSLGSDKKDEVNFSSFSSLLAVKTSYNNMGISTATGASIFVRLGGVITSVSGGNFPTSSMTNYTVSSDGQYLTYTGNNQISVTLQNAENAPMTTGGGLMTGNLNMGSNNVSSSSNPTSDDHLTRKAWVDSQLSQKADNTTVNNLTTQVNNLASSKADNTTVNNLTTQVNNLASSKADLSYVDGKFTSLIGGAGSALDTLKELGDALNNDASFGNIVINKINTKLDLSGGVIAGDLTVNRNNISTGLQIPHDSKYSGIKRKTDTGDLVFFKDADRKIVESAKTLVEMKGEWATYDFGSPIELSSYYISTIPPGLTIYRCIVAGSSDGINFTSVHESNTPVSNQQLIKYQFTSSFNYRYLRLIITNYQSTNYDESYFYLRFYLEKPDNTLVLNSSIQNVSGSSFFIQPPNQDVVKLSTNLADIWNVAIDAGWERVGAGTALYNGPNYSYVGTQKTTLEVESSPNNLDIYANVIAGNITANSFSATSDPSDNNHLTRKGWVDSQISNVNSSLSTLSSNVNSSLSNKLDKSGGTISGNLTVSGNLNVLGSTVTINTESLEVKDNVVVLAKGNTSDSLESGLLVQYADGNGNTRYSGMKRKPVTGEFEFVNEGSTLETKGGWIQYDLPSFHGSLFPSWVINNGVILKYMNVRDSSNWDQFILSKFYVLGSNDGGFNWEIIHQQTTTPTSDKIYFNSNKFYKNFRITVSELEKTGLYEYVSPPDPANLLYGWDGNTESSIFRFQSNITNNFGNTNSSSWVPVSDYPGYSVSGNLLIYNGDKKTSILLVEKTYAPIITAGGVMRGDLDMSGNNVSSSSNPTSDNHLTRKAWVDSQISKVDTSFNSVNNSLLDLSANKASITYVNNEITKLTGPNVSAALDTLKELGDALNNDANFASSVTNSLSHKLDLSGGVMRGDLDMSGNNVSSTSNPTSDNHLTRKAWVDSQFVKSESYVGDNINLEILGDNSLSSYSIEGDVIENISLFGSSDNSNWKKISEETSLSNNLNVQVNDNNYKYLNFVINKFKAKEPVLIPQPMPVLEIPQLSGLTKTYSFEYGAGGLGENSVGGGGGGVIVKRDGVELTPKKSSTHATVGKGYGAGGSSLGLPSSGFIYINNNGHEFFWDTPWTNGGGYGTDQSRVDSYTLPNSGKTVIIAMASGGFGGSIRGGSSGQIRVHEFNVVANQVLYNLWVDYGDWATSWGGLDGGSGAGFKYLTTWYNSYRGLKGDYYELQDVFNSNKWTLWTNTGNNNTGFFERGYKKGGLNSSGEKGELQPI
jgi:hypothetical protein